MSLFVYNITGSPVTLVAGNSPPVIPASPSPPDRGEPVNVTSELRGLSAGDYNALEAQRPGTLEYRWTSYAEYDIGYLHAHQLLQEFETSFMFRSVAPGAFTIPIGGFYSFAGTANDFNPSISFGVANLAYAGHIGFVAGPPPAGGTTIRVTGTSITDLGVRTTSDFEDVVFDSSDPLNLYKETAKKFIGQVTIVKQAGDDRLFNYGWTKYWDYNNKRFALEGFEFTWYGGANDAGADLIVYHHKTTGWTYNAAAPPIPPIIAQMSATHGAERQVGANQPGAFKRSDLHLEIRGDLDEGLVAVAVQTTGQPFDAGTLLYHCEA